MGTADLVTARQQAGRQAGRQASKQANDRQTSKQTSKQGEALKKVSSIKFVASS